MEELIELITNPNDVADWHRGMKGEISVGTSGETKSYSVVCKSKYRLKSGDTRIKFIGKQIEKQVHHLSAEDINTMILGNPLEVLYERESSAGSL